MTSSPFICAFFCRKFPRGLRLFINECLRFALFEVVPQREMLCPKHLFSLIHVRLFTLFGQTAITAASHPLFNEQNKLWQLTSSLSPSNTFTLICRWFLRLGPSEPPFPPRAFCFCFIILQLSRMTVIFWTGDTYSQTITPRRKRTFVCCLN